MPTAPPRPARRPVLRRLHGEQVEDPWAWLADRDADEVRRHLEAENAWTEACLGHLAPLRERLFEELRSRVQETDRSVPARQGAYWYYERTVEGLDHPIHCRAATGPDGPEEVLLDANRAAEGLDYFDLGCCAVSPDGSRLAFSIDAEGDELYRLRFRDLEGGEELPETIEGVCAGGVFDATGEHFLYVVPDDALRPHQLCLHRLGTQLEDDELLYEEEDEHFAVEIDRSRDDRWLILSLESHTTSEQWLLPAGEPRATPRCVAPRTAGVQYWVEPQGARFVLLTTEGAPDGRVFALDRDSLERTAELLAPDPARKIEDVETFPDAVALVVRREGRPRIELLRRGAPEPEPIDVPDAVASVELGEHLEFGLGALRIESESLATPHATWELPLRGGALRLLKREQVPGAYDPEALQSEALWATSRDGTRVPVSLVRRLDRPPDGTGALVLYAYGAYEMSSDPWFSPGRLSLLDRGVAFAIAHVRGGGELGRTWHDAGKLDRKQNGIDDLMACAEALVAGGYAARDRMALRVESAGGLLAGAVVNQRPELFRAVLAEVPFTDLVNTLLDPSLPLTVGEWEEWGDPDDPAQYRWLRAYAPYENVAPGPYPAVLATAGLHDPRVGAWEPAKWIARLREATTSEAPLLLRTSFEAGHDGPSGRTATWREEAYVLAFLLDALGAA